MQALSICRYWFSNIHIDRAILVVPLDKVLPETKHPKLKKHHIVQMSASMGVSFCHVILHQSWK
jgi:hypothetical protein